jgi:hypothetical protein
MPNGSVTWTGLSGRSHAWDGSLTAKWEDNVASSGERHTQGPILRTKRHFKTRMLSELSGDASGFAAGWHCSARQMQQLATTNHENITEWRGDLWSKTCSKADFPIPPSVPTGDIAIACASHILGTTEPGLQRYGVWIRSNRWGSKPVSSRRLSPPSARDITSGGVCPSC